MSYASVSLVDGSGEIEEARRLNRNAPLNSGMVRVSAVASGVRALAKWANQASVAWRIDQELEAQKSSIDASIRNWSDNNPTGICYPVEDCGCLVHVILSTPSNWPGDRPLSFVTLFEAACGRDPAETLLEYLRTDNLVQGTPEGTEPIWQFIWVKVD